MASRKKKKEEPSLVELFDSYWQAAVFRIFGFGLVFIVVEGVEPRTGFIAGLGLEIGIQLFRFYKKNFQNKE